MQRPSLRFVDGDDGHGPSYALSLQFVLLHPLPSLISFAPQRPIAAAPAASLPHGLRLSPVTPPTTLGGKGWPEKHIPLPGRSYVQGPLSDA